MAAPKPWIAVPPHREETPIGKDSVHRAEVGWTVVDSNGQPVCEIMWRADAEEIAREMADEVLHMDEQGALFG